MNSFVRLFLSAFLLVTITLVAPNPAAHAQNYGPGSGMGTPQAQMVQGRNFTYLLPAGWRTVEEGNHALVLSSYDQSVGVIVYGSSGFGQGLSPHQYAHAAITRSLRLAPDVRISNPQPIQPMPGYTSAAVMEIAYTSQRPDGQQFPSVGLVISNVVSVYARSDAVITVMLARASHWGAVQSWLPQVAMRAMNTGPNPFGRTGMSQTILNNSVQQRESYGQYLNWSQQNWAGVVAQRAASLDMRAKANGENLTGQYWSQNPHTGNPQRYSTTPSVTWVHRDGRVVESSNSGYNPNSPTDQGWRPVQR